MRTRDTNTLAVLLDTLKVLLQREQQRQKAVGALSVDSVVIGIDIGIAHDDSGPTIKVCICVCGFSFSHVNIYPSEAVM